MTDAFDFTEGYMQALAAASAFLGPSIPFDDAPRKHLVYVQLRPGGFFASCVTCGCDPFPDRRWLAEAEADARAHGELRHNYPRAILLDHEQNPGPNTQGDGMATSKEVGVVEGFKASVETVERLAAMIETLVEVNQKGIKLDERAVAAAATVIRVARTGLASMRDVIAQIEEVSG